MAEVMAATLSTGLMGKPRTFTASDRGGKKHVSFSYARAVWR
jgi:hypothetical protein